MLLKFTIMCIVYMYLYMYMHMFYGGLAIVATVLPTENDSDVIFVFNNC